MRPRPRRNSLEGAIGADTVAVDRQDAALSRMYREHRLPLVHVGVLPLGDQAAAEDVFIGGVGDACVPAGAAAEASA